MSDYFGLENGKFSFRINLDKVSLGNPRPFHLQFHYKKMKHLMKDHFITPRFFYLIDLMAQSQYQVFVMKVKRFQFILNLNVFEEIFRIFKIFRYTNNLKVLKI